ncbi:unnamed protein product [Adineta ricciae]|uniref:Uncharacterized protein n=1 Tax=Adineta ricciae TaxID=249248 RepID=A0A814EV58_ADIRI|nr:unnamed protein product [Adineta ricciae]
MAIFVITLLKLIVLLFNDLERYSTEQTITSLPFDKQIQSAHSSSNASNRTSPFSLDYYRQYVKQKNREQYISYACGLLEKVYRNVARSRNNQ